MWPPSIHRFWTEKGEVILFNIRGKLDPCLSFGFQVRAREAPTEPHLLPASTAVADFFLANSGFRIGANAGAAAGEAGGAGDGAGRAEVPGRRRHDGPNLSTATAALAPVNHSRCPYARARPYRGRNQNIFDPLPLVIA
jgi:hypothetical protein